MNGISIFLSSPLHFLVGIMTAHFSFIVPLHSLMFAHFSFLLLHFTKYLKLQLISNFLLVTISGLPLESITFYPLWSHTFAHVLGICNTGNFLISRFIVHNKCTISKQVVNISRRCIVPIIQDVNREYYIDGSDVECSKHHFTPTWSFFLTWAQSVSSTLYASIEIRAEFWKITKIACPICK